MNFQQIREQYLYGEFAIRGNRMAEVISADKCCHHWWFFGFIDNKMVISSKPAWAHNLSYKEAKAEAKAFLLSDDPMKTCPHEFDLPVNRRV